MPVKPKTNARKRKRTEGPKKNVKKRRKKMNCPVDRKRLPNEDGAHLYKDEVRPGIFEWRARKPDEKTAEDLALDKFCEEKILGPIQKQQQQKKCEPKKCDICGWYGENYYAFNGHQTTCPYKPKNWEKTKNGGKSGPNLGLRFHWRGREVVLVDKNAQKISVRCFRSGKISKVKKSSLEYPKPLEIEGTVTQILSHRPACGTKSKDGTWELECEMQDGQKQYIHVFDLSASYLDLLHQYKKANDNCIDKTMRKVPAKLLYVRQWGSKEAELYAPDPSKNITTLCEPFAGGAAQSLHFLNKFDHIERVIVTDLDERVYRRWRYWKSQTAEEIQKLPIISVKETLYDKTEKVQNLSCMDIFSLGFMIAQKTYTLNLKVNHQQCGWSESQREYLATNVDILSKVEVHNCSFLDFDWPNTENVGYMIDPPYQHSLKKNQHESWDVKGGYYKTDRLDYNKVLEFTLSRKGYVVVSESKYSKWVNDPRFKKKFIMIVDSEKKSSFWIKQEFENDFSKWVASLGTRDRKKFCNVKKPTKKKSKTK